VRIAYKTLFGKPEGQKRLGDLDERTILKWILERYGVRGHDLSFAGVVFRNTVMKLWV
jgi:hypothetical protein